MHTRNCRSARSHFKYFYLFIHSSSSPSSSPEKKKNNKKKKVQYTDKILKKINANISNILSVCQWAVAL